MGLREEQIAFLEDVCKLLEFCRRAGFEITGGELYRTPEQQQIYVSTGRSQTLQSNHLRRLAIDLNIFKGGALCSQKSQLLEVGKFWESLHPKNRWGGNFKTLVDTPHFERNV
jgi:hypothetical protein